jgi:hypothetical protein
MHALAPLGIVHLDMPLTAQRIWQAISNSQCQMMLPQLVASSN